MDNSFFYAGKMVFAALGVIAHSFCSAQTIEEVKEKSSYRDLRKAYTDNKQTLSGDSLGAICRLIGVYFYQHQEYDSALFWLDRAVVHAKDSMRLARYHKGRAAIMIKQDRFADVPECLSFATRYLPSHSDPMFGIELNSLMSKYCTFTGKFADAFSYGYQTLAEAEEVGDSILIYSAALNLGLTYYKVFDSQSAIQYFTRAKRMASNQFSRVGYRDIPITNLALAYNQAGQHKEVFDCLNNLVSRGNKPTDEVLMHVYYAYGQASLSIGLTDSAKLFFKKSLRLAVQGNMQRFVSENWLSLARVSIDRHQFDSARDYNSVALRIAETNDYADVVLRALGDRIAIEKGSGKIGQMLHFQRRFIAETDELFHLSTSAVIGGAIAHDLEEQYQESLALEKAIVAGNRLKQEDGKLMGYVQAALIVGLVLLVVVLYNSYTFNLNQRRRLVEAIHRRESYLIKRIEAIEKLFRFGSSYLGAFGNYQESEVSSNSGTC